MSTLTTHQVATRGIRHKGRTPRRQPSSGFRILPWGKVTAGLTAVSVILVAVSFCWPYAMNVPLAAWDEPGRAWFDVGNENNLPTWWNAIMLMFGSLAAMVVAFIHGPRVGTGRSPRAAWSIIAVLLLLMGLDEIASVHERLGRIADAALPDHGFTYAWLAVGIPLALIVTVAAVFITRGIGGVPRRLILVGLLVLFTGAVGLETANDLLVRFTDQQGPTHPDLFHVIYHGEELLELIGAGLLVAAPLSSVVVGHLGRGDHNGADGPDHDDGGANVSNGGNVVVRPRIRRR